MQEQGRFSFAPKEDALGAEKRVGFSCERYGMWMKTEVAKVNRQKTCAERREGEERVVRRECGNCGYWIAVGS